MPDLATFCILIDGEEVSGELQILTVVVQRQINRIPMAKLIIVDGDAAQSTFEISAGESFTPGRELTVKAGYSNNERQFFKGIITKHAIKAKRDSRSALHIEARDVLFKTTITRQNRYFEEETDSAIISEILTGYSITSDVSDTDVTHPVMVQHNTTDWDFIMARAQANGLLLQVTDGEIKIAAPDVSQSPVLELNFGAEILSLEMEMDSRNQLDSVTTKSWNSADQEVTETEADEPENTDQGNIDAEELAQAAGDASQSKYNIGEISEEELQAWADGELFKSRISKICGRIAAEGTSEVTIDTIVTLGGLGDRFNGNAYVSGIRHELSQGHWQTDIQVGLAPEISIQSQQNLTNLLPAINDLHIAKVIELEDPDASGRIRVRLPLVHPEGSGLWARLSTLDAGNNRGTVFRPEIDDEVVVGFFGGDPRTPVILGGLHSAANTPPIEAADDNHIKGYVSRGEMKLTFNDETNILSLETPAGNSLFLDEEQEEIRLTDQHGNSIVMNSDGIAMTSIANVNFTSDSDTTIESTGNMSMTSSGDITQEGSNVTTTASGQLSVSGSGGAEISSSGQTVVSGSLVAIN